MTGLPGVYTRRPVPVRAIQYTGDNLAEVNSFHGRLFAAEDTGPCGLAIPITTSSGTVYARCGWWIAEQPNGQLLTIAPDEFDGTCDLEEEQPA